VLGFLLARTQNVATSEPLFLGAFRQASAFRPEVGLVSPLSNFSSYNTSLSEDLPSFLVRWVRRDAPIYDQFVISMVINLT
jgi:hypothetical protein